MRVPDISALEHTRPAAPTFAEFAARWQASRVDVRESTAVQHRTALNRVLPVSGARPVDAIMTADVADLVARLAGEGKARESIRKSVTATAMVLDFAGITPNPARSIGCKCACRARIPARWSRPAPSTSRPWHGY